MVSPSRICLVTCLAILIGSAQSSAQKPTDKKQPGQPKKLMDKKEEGKKGPKVVVEKKVIVLTSPSNYMPGVAFGWNYYWPGPVLPGMYGGPWGGMWPYSWWMGGPYVAGRGFGPGSCCWGGGAYPVILPPVFRLWTYPAVSPYWTPYVAPYWTVPAAVYPVIVGSDDRPSRKAHEYRTVPTSATAEKLFADALWLFSDENYKSARDHLAAAVKQSPRDARMWYFKALSERAMKDESAAKISAENGAALEIMGVTDKRTILTSLERIQGPDREFLTEKVSGSKALSLKAAADRVAKLKSTDTTVASSGK